MSTPIRFAALTINLQNHFQPATEPGNFQSVTLETVDKARRVDPKGAEPGYWQRDTLGDVYVNTRLVGKSQYLKETLAAQKVPEWNSDALRAFLNRVLDSVEIAPPREQQTWYSREKSAFAAFTEDLKPGIQAFITQASPYAERRVLDSISIFFADPQA